MIVRLTKGSQSQSPPYKLQQDIGVSLGPLRPCSTRITQLISNGLKKNDHNPYHPGDTTTQTRATQERGEQFFWKGAHHEPANPHETHPDRRWRRTPP
jgi:hypothetical protein